MDDFSPLFQAAARAHSVITSLIKSAYFDSPQLARVFAWLRKCIKVIDGISDEHASMDACETGDYKGKMRFFSPSWISKYDAHLATLRTKYGDIDGKDEDEEEEEEEDEDEDGGDGKEAEEEGAEAGAGFEILETEKEKGEEVNQGAGQDRENQGANTKKVAGGKRKRDGKPESGCSI